MCGIAGYVGKEKAQPVLLEALKRLEYRGYDSAGIAVADESGRIGIRKRAGRITRLEALVRESPLSGSCGIGHTRWATHGMPTDANAHPQTDERGGIAVVHNGTIENFQALKGRLLADGVRFASETDTEVIAHLLSRAEGDMLHALHGVLPLLRGRYALAVVTRGEPGRVFCARRGSPLVLGRADGAFLLSSDIPALLPLTKEICVMEEGHIAVLERNGIRLYDEALRPETAVFRAAGWEPGAAEKGDHPYFMQKEIWEQPLCVARTAALYLEKPPRAVPPAGLDIVACGTALHAAKAGAYFFKHLAGVPVRAFAASEYRCDPPLPVSGALTLAISQSGETADTLSALEAAKRRGPTAVLTNTAGSTLTRVADATFLTCAGPEIAVASTKAFTAQLTALLLMAAETGRQNGFLPTKKAEALLSALRATPGKMDAVLHAMHALDGLAAHAAGARVCFFIGRGVDYTLAQEGALKLRETAAQPCGAYPAGELKHGPIALVEKGTPVIALCGSGDTLEKTLLNLRETKARGAETVCLCPDALAGRARQEADTVFAVPDAPETLTPLLLCLPLQWLACRAAVARGLDPDKPRNLAKSVTVE